MGNRCCRQSDCFLLDANVSIGYKNKIERIGRHMNVLYTFNSSQMSIMKLCRKKDCTNPANIYLFKVKICSKIIKTPEQRRR